MTSEVDSAAGLFAAYSEHKGWTQRFHVSPDETDYFKVECRGIPLKGRQVLEIGFGPGTFLAWAEGQGANISGAEIDPASVAAAKERGIPLIPADFEHVAHTYAERYDLIAGFDVFEHFPQDRITARLEACGVMLKPQGILLLRFPNAQSPFGQAPQHGDATHIIALSGAKIAQLAYGLPFRTLRYGNSARPAGRGPVKWMARALRYLAQDLIEGVIAALYTPSTPLGPVVTLVMQKTSDESEYQIRAPKTLRAK